jgi:regulator of replication initiation timing
LDKYAQENADLRAENEKLRQQLKDAQTNADIYTIPDEDPFIRNMVMKSKKKTCKITLSIKFDLPPKEVYDTIKTAYEDGMAENFVSSLTARIPRQSLLDSLNQGLTKFYEGTSSSKNSGNTSPEVQK